MTPLRRQINQQCNHIQVRRRYQRGAPFLQIGRSYGAGFKVQKHRSITFDSILF